MTGHRDQGVSGTEKKKEREGKASSFSDQDTGTKDKKIFYPYRKKAGSAEGLQDRKGAAGDSSCA